MYNVTGPSVKPLKVRVSVNKVDIDMEVDTGASVSIISEETYNRLWSRRDRPALQQSAITLRTYSGEQLTIKGTIEVDVQYKDQEAHLQLVVATGQGPSLLGKDWLLKIRLGWTGLNCVLIMHVILSPCRIPLMPTKPTHQCSAQS